MDEWQHLFTQRKAFIYGGYFNVHSTLWGYRYEDSRRDSIVEHLIVNNLGVSNIHNTDGAFQNKDSGGRIVTLVWSDLIVANLLALPNITNDMFQILTLAPITNTYGLLSHDNFIYTKKTL